MRRLLAASLLLAAAAARGQTMLDQEQRLIEIHSLLLDLPPVGPPSTLRWREASLGLEVVGIPDIDGTTGGKRQLTASDHLRAFPRPRLALGLPAPGGFRAFAGLTYVPPLEVRTVKVHQVAGEAGITWLSGEVRLGLRLHALYARSESAVSDPATRDVLRVGELGLDAAVGYDVAAGPLVLTPYAGGGFTHLSGRFLVTSDDARLHSRFTTAVFHGGLRALLSRRWEAAAEVEAWPERLVQPRFRIAYLLDLGAAPAP